MKRMNLIASLLGAAAIASLAGCGSDNRESSATASFTASQACIACHTTYKSPVTGNNIVTEWQASAHNTRNGASCPDCHATNGHPSSGALPNIPGDTVCLNCHTSVTMKSYSSHFFGSATYNATRAAYVTPYDTNTCRVCHNPHDTTTLLTVNRQWKQSGHGNVTADPWMHYKWRTAPFNYCQRCHTAGGFRNLMTTGTAPSSAIFGKYTTGREALGCKGCHTDYSWKRIQAFKPFSTPYNPSLGASKGFPSATTIGDTQLCIPCHTGLNSGYQAVETSAADLTNTSFAAFNSHYMAAAGLMYVKAGFTGFTSAGAVLGTSTYGKSLTSTDDGGAIGSYHRRLGTPGNVAFNGVALDSGGPCVTCHMKGGHSLAINADSFTRVCGNCHTREGATTLTSSNFMSVFVDPQGDLFQNALNLAFNILKTRYNISYNQAAYPYFYDESLPLVNGNKQAIKDWTRGGTLTLVSARKLAGACFNLNLLQREPAAYVHARTYTRRLVYDTIDFLDDGVMNWSAGATAIAQNPALYGKGSVAYTDGTLTTLGAGTTDSMLYLIGWSRTTGAWTTPLERP